MDVNARGPVNKAVVDLYDAEHPDEAPAVVFDPEQHDSGETPPDVKPRKGLAGKLNLGGGKSKEPKVRKPQGRRQSLEKVGGYSWQILGQAVASAGFVPAARVINMQAPIAGMVLEDSFKGSPADRMLQPVVRMVSKGGAMGALLGPVIMVTLIQKNPKLYPALKPHLEEALWSYVETAGPYFEKLEARREKRAKMISEQGFDMEALIVSLFAPMPGPEQQEESSEDPSGA